MCAWHVSVGAARFPLGGACLVILGHLLSCYAQDFAPVPALVEAFLGLLSAGSTPEKIRYHVMPPASRLGSRTGALDVGAEAGTTVYSPVNGTVVAIRPDPVLQDGAKVVEIKPIDAPELRVSVALVGDIQGEVGPKSPVTAGMTALGSVADSAEVLRPQLAGYTSGSGNHVTVSASRVD